MADGPDPQFARYSNQELEAFLANPGINETQKSQVRQELTRRMRDDLLKSTQGAIQTKTVERRKQAWKMGRLSFLVVIILICIVSMLCILLFAQPELFHRIFGSASVLNMVLTSHFI